MAHALGYQILSMTVDGQGNGLTTYAHEPPVDDQPKTIEFFRRNALIALAGWIQDTTPSHGSAADWSSYTENAYRLVCLGGTSSFDAFFAQAVPEVHSILTPRQQAFTRLAAALEQKRNLGQDETAGILTA